MPVRTGRGVAVTDPVPRLRDMWRGASSRDGYDYGPPERVAFRAMSREEESALDQSGSSQGGLSAALDPRQRIYRDPFNELVVFVISAAGASTIVPILLLIVGAFTGQFSFWIFVAASVLLELILIFGLARPAMKPNEKVGWALLWGFSAAVLGAAFWELVFAPVLT